MINFTNIYEKHDNLLVLIVYIFIPTPKYILHICRMIYITTIIFCFMGISLELL